MRKIKYEGKYLTKEIVESCFIESELTQVDKTFCGNGFTHNFLRLTPSLTKFNILIVPNIEVAINKREDYLNSKDDRPTTGFFGDFEGANGVGEIFRGKYQVVVIVSDTFVIYLRHFLEYVNSIDKIMVDEAHSMYIQSSYRNKLKKIIKALRDDFKGTTRAYVTATPMLFQDIDIKLHKDLRDDEYKTINITSNVKDRIESIKNRLDNGDKILVATQDKHIIREIADGRKVNFKIGNTLMGNVAELIKIDQDVESNLTIISSRGFEGFDLLNGVNDIEIFGNRSYDHTQFFFQNIIQIIGRSRKGVGNVNYCLLSRNTIPKKIRLEDMERKIAKRKKSFAKLLTDDNNKDLREFYSIDSSGGFINGLELDKVSYDLYEESLMFDEDWFTLYDEYALDRGFKINLNITNRKDVNRKGKITHHSQKLSRLIENKPYLDENGIFDNLNPSLATQDDRKGYIKTAYEFVRKRYYSDYPSDKLSLPSFDLMLDENEFNSVVKELTKAYREKKLNEYGYNKHPQYKEDVEKFVSVIEDIAYKLCLMFLQDKVFIPSNVTIFRDYNLTTKTSALVLGYFSGKFGFNYLEADISKCNPKLIYANLGLMPPDNFYGDNNENKRKINILLNSLSKEYAIEKGINPTDRKKNVKRELKAYGFDEMVIEWLMSEFWDKPKDALFNWCAYHERELIRKTRNKLEYYFGDGFNWIRRHDSLITFTKDDEMTLERINRIVNDVEYFGFKYWYYRGKSVVEMRCTEDEIAGENQLKIAI